MRHLNACCSVQVFKRGVIKRRYSLGARWPLTQVSFNAQISSRLQDSSKVRLSSNLKLKTTKNP